ncbi:MAG: protease inhibitor I42 family protein [Clostridia bacterium]|nr:protease inhibitor I42 family protein [Clostridia bacterium]
MIKKFVCLFLGLVLMASAAYAAQDYEIELTDSRVLTVRLEANESAGYSWDYEISNENAIDMLTNEYVVYDDELDGSGGQFAISFRAFDGVTGDSLITFNYAHASGQIVDKVILQVRADDGEIFVDRADSFSVSGDILTVSLDANATTGYEWVSRVETENMLEPVAEEYIPADTELSGAGGVYRATFKSAGNAGEARIVFDYARSWEDGPEYSIACDVNIDEDGVLELGEIAF